MSIFTKAGEWVNARLDSSINDLRKANAPNEEVFNNPMEDLFKGMKADGSVSRKGLLFDPFHEQGAFAGGLYKGRTTFLPPHLLKQVSRKDSIVASIIDVRASQVSSACRKQTNRFDMGFKLIAKNNSVQVDDKEVRKIEEFILNCGKIKEREVADKLTFDQWGYMITGDWMRYGHCAIELVRDGQGDLYGFLPLPADTIYYANKKIDNTLIESMKNMWKEIADPDLVDVTKATGGEYEFLQMINGKVTEGFTDKELIFERINMEADIDLNGYAVGPLERAIAAVTSHLQIENHQKAFFTHGAASKGILVIQGDVAPNTLKALQAQWTQQITGPLNAWRTPILAGIEGVQWVPLVSTNRDMEYAAYQDHILRTMFSCFAMDPEEAGFGYLSKGTEQRSMGESSNEWKITASRDRGLRPLLGRIEAIINERVIPELNKDWASKYHFTFVGLDSETEMEETERMQAEVSLHTSVNEIRIKTDRDPLPFGGDLILNPILLQTLQANMYKGDFMETYMGIQGASQRPDLQYIPEPFWFQQQQMQMGMMQQQAGGQPGGDPNAPQGGQPGEDEEGPNGYTDDQEAGQEQEGAPPEVQGDSDDESARKNASGAVDQYIAGNPELFKHLRKNLESSGMNLIKSEPRSRKINDKHVDRMRNDLVKDFRFASGKMIEEILLALKSEVDDGSDKGDK